MFTLLALGDASSPSESSKYKKFLCFVLFLVTILAWFDADLELQTPLNLDLFWIRIQNISFYKLQTHQV